MTGTVQPLVSIITPTYNRGQTYLRETIDSVLEQDYSNFEYIVLDDGSTDNTCDLLASLDDPRLHWETHQNMGETRTVNKGFRMAQGEYIIVLSSDDKLLPGAISTAVSFMEAHPNVLVGYPDFQIIDGDSQPVNEVQSPEYSYSNMLRWHHCFPQVGTIIRRSALEHEPERDPAFRYRGDFEFWLRMGLHGPFAHIPATLASWRQHTEGATSARWGPELAAETVAIVEKLYSRPDLSSNVRKLRRPALAAACMVAGLECLPHHRREARRYFLHSIFACPFCRRERPYGLLINWFHMLRIVLLPGFARRLLWPLRKLMTRNSAS